MGTSKKRAESTLHIGNDVVNIIWQPKYIGTRREAWLLESKMRQYDGTKNHTVYITFERDCRYGLSGRVFRVLGGSLHIALECELFYHEGTGFAYYRIPLDDLVEVLDVPLPEEFLQRVAEHKALHEDGGSAEAENEPSLEIEEENFVYEEYDAEYCEEEEEEQ